MIIRFKRIAPANVSAYVLELGELAVSFSYYDHPAALFIGDASGKTLLNPLAFTKTESDNAFVLDNDNTVARLSESGHIAIADLPQGDFIDLEFWPSLANFPIEGTGGIIYFAADTEKEYIWITYDRHTGESGKYIEINSWAETGIDGGSV